MAAWMLLGTALGVVWNVSPSIASELGLNISDFSIENWQVEQGLPQISVISIAQTPDGYLWLGTFNGLVRFDGVRFTVFNEANTPALGANGILRLITDPEGALWILTQEGGLARLVDGQFTKYGPQQGLPVCGAAALVLDLEDHLLVVDRDGGLHQIESGRLATPPPGQLPAGADRRLLVAPSEPCWVEKDGRAVNSSGVPLRFPITGGNEASGVELEVRCATRSHTGGFWLAATSGVYRLERRQVQGPAAPFPQAMSTLVSMAEDRRGNLWVGTWAGGLFRRDPSGQWQQFCAGTGLANNDVAALYVDREDNVWVGTGGGGLYRFRPTLFRTYDTRDGLAGNTVTSVNEDRHGRLWVGANGGGVNRLEGRRFVPVTEPVELSRYRLVYSVLADRQDQLWIGLYGGVALRLRESTLTLSTSEPGFLYTTPRALFEDRSGSVWLGCDKGLQRYEGGRFTVFTQRNGLAHDEVRALAQGRDGTLYIGTKAGLNSLSNGQFKCYTGQNGLPDDHVMALWVDRDDTLWIGTVNGGLGRLHRERFDVVRTQDGLPSNTIGTIVEDDSGHLWLGSNRGIVRVNRQHLNQYIDGQQSTFTCRLFNRSDGLNSIDCTGGGQPASWKAHDGRLWFATVKGVAVVDPAHLPVNSLVPPVVIEDVVVDEVSMASDVSEHHRSTVSQRGVATSRGAQNSNRPAQIPPTAGAGMSGRTLMISPGKHRLEFRFTGLSLVAPEKVRFRYRLSGLDDTWIEAGSQRNASYNHVPPKTYRFEVTACNNDGVWNETGAALSIVVLPPWWMTWWFRALTVMAVAGLVLGWYERRLRGLRRERLAQESFSRRLIALQENERQRLAGELHDGMGQDLLVIASQAQLSLSQAENPSGTTARLKDIAETAKHALQQARRMAHNLRPGLVEELGLTKAVKATLDKAGQASAIRMRIAISDVDGLLPPEFEVSLFRIVQETLNNVLKHASATEANVSLTTESSVLRLIVEDNGRGFELSRMESQPSLEHGFGLRQIAERAKMMGGRIDIQSRPGQGTRLTVEVPLRGSTFHAS